QVISQSATRRLLHEVMRRNPRIALPETKQPEQQSRWRDRVKCPAPSEMRADHATNHITERAPNRDCRTKNGHDAPTRLNRKQIRQDRRRGRSVTALAN